MQIGLLPSGVSNKRFFTGVDLLILLCIDSWMNEYSDPRFRISQAQGLQMRLEYLSHLTNSVPTFWQICAKISSLQSFLLDGLKRFSVEINLDFKLPNLTLKLQLQSLYWSLYSSRSLHYLRRLNVWFIFSQAFVLAYPGFQRIFFSDRYFAAKLRLTRRKAPRRKK